MEQKGISRFGVFICLVIGFLTLGFAGTYILYTGAKETYYKQVRVHLKSIAQLSSLQLSPKSITKLNEPKQSDSLEFISLTDKLESIIEKSENVTHLSILKSIGPQYYFIADASTLGQSASKSQLLDPADEISTELIAAVTNKKVSATARSHQDRWGTWYSAYAPILDDQQNVIGVLAVDADAQQIDKGDLDLQLKYQITTGIVIFLCIALAWLTSGPVRSGINSAITWNNSPFKKLITEGIVVLAILALCFEIGFSIIRQNHLTQLSQKVAYAQTAIQRIDEVVHSLQSGYKLSKQDLSRLKKLLLAAGYGKTYDKLQSINGSKTIAISQFDSIYEDCSNIAETIKKDTASINELQGVQAQANLRLLLGIMLLSSATLLLARYSSNLNQTINQTVDDSNSIQAQLSSLVENLPVGMFVIENGGITFTNSEWRFQVGTAEGKNNLETFGKSIYPDDRDEVMKLVLESARDAKPFDIQYRIVKPNSPVLHVETRGVPVYDTDGICRRMIAFTIDFTAAVEAKHALEGAYGEVEHKNRLLADALAELEQNLESVVKALVKAVEAKDPYTAGHSERVMQYSLWLGEAIGLGPYEKRILELGTLVHDVGKIGIPDAILTKPDRLTDEEYDIIKKHPEYGVNIIGNIQMFKECLPIVRWHHERLDGRGYPDGLKGDELSILVRISAIADIFDAMTSTRAYRTGMDLDKVLNIMNQLAENGEIDQHLFVTFCQVVHQKGIIPQQVVQEPWKAA